MCIHSLSSFCALEPVSISANKDILILLLLAQMKRTLQTWDVIVYDVSNSCCGPPPPPPYMTVQQVMPLFVYHICLGKGY